MDINHLKSQINDRFQNMPIQSAAIIVDPEDHLDNQNKIRVTLQSFVETQHPDTPFALQLMASNSQITIYPLGLVDINEIKEYENKKRQETGELVNNKNSNVGMPLVVQFEPHVKDHPIDKTVTEIFTDDLFKDFSKVYANKLWPVIMKYLNENQTILLNLEKELVNDNQQVYEVYLKNLHQMSETELKDSVGFSLSKDQIDHYANYMADLKQVNAIIESTGAFIFEQLLKDKSFIEIMNDDLYRNTFIWSLDNAYVEIIYFFITKYSKKDIRIKKRLNRIRKNLASIMRTDILTKAGKIVQKNEDLDLHKFLEEIFIPIAENIEVEIKKFT